MHDLIVLIAHILSMLARLAGTAGVRSVIGVGLAQASIADRESSAPSCAKPSRDRPVHRCRLFSFHSSGSSGAISDHIEAIHDREFPPELGEAEMSPSLLAEAKSETRIAFQDYFNTHRSHAALKGQTPIETPESKSVDFKSYR